MGHTNSTPNLHLPQFIGSDKPTWLSDVNGAMLAIDTAYGTIEAQASSAATAATGAVTTANAAQTAAEGAASAAATAGTNASQALSTANNAVTTANNAMALVNKGSVEVSADGVKTAAALFNELYAAANTDKIDINSKIVFDNTVLTCYYLDSNSFSFSAISRYQTNVVANYVDIRPSSSYYVGVGSLTLTDKSSEVLPSGTKIKLYY